MLGGGGQVVARQLRRRAAILPFPPQHSSGNSSSSRGLVGYDGLSSSSSSSRRRGRRAGWARSSSSGSSGGASGSSGEAAGTTAAAASTTSGSTSTGSGQGVNGDAPLVEKKRPTRQTFRQFVELARPEAPAFLTALLAVAVGTGTTVAFPFAIGKCMDAMTLGGKGSAAAAATATTATAAEGGTAGGAAGGGHTSSQWAAFFGGGGKGSGGGESGAVTSPSGLLTDAATTSGGGAGSEMAGMTAREFVLESFGPEHLPPAWLLDLIPPDAEPLAALSAGLVGVFVLGACATFVRNVAVNLAGERIAARLRKRVFAAVLHRRLAFFDATRTGELLNRLSNDVTQVSKTLSADTSYFLRNFAQGAGALGMMLYTSPQLCAIMLGVIPPVAAWGVFFGRRVRALSKNMADELAAAGTIAEERVANIRAVRALGNDTLEVARYGHQVDNVFRLAKYQSLLQGVFYGVAMGSGNLGMVTVLYYGGQYVNQGLITVGDLSTMLLYSVYAGFSISALLSYYGDLMKAAGSAERIFDLMEVDRKALAARNSREEAAAAVTTSAACPVVPTAADVAGPISFQNVSFAYPTRPDAPVLAHLDLGVREGETIALVGPSGSGKSSVAALLARMYEPDAGQILMGPRQVPLASVPKRTLRKAVSYVTQDAVLFSGTVRENLFLGFADLDAVGPEPRAQQQEMAAPSPSGDSALHFFPLREPLTSFEYTRAEGWDMGERMDRVREACRVANCLDFIEAWDQGFDTVIGERGAQLSGGQRARLALARAILRDSRLLLLDEISAALDSVSEAALHSALERVLQDRTAILIAHRWSSIQIADRVAVLGSAGPDGGSRVIEIGTPQDLLSTSADSAFRRLVEHQLKGTAGGRGGGMWR